jgi:hypothetical protein
MRMSQIIFKLLLFAGALGISVLFITSIFSMFPPSFSESIPGALAANPFILAGLVVGLIFAYLNQSLLSRNVAEWRELKPNQLRGRLLSPISTILIVIGFASVYTGQP